ncbi:hypothetical protein B4065_3741 [Caldibacillus thermoamylovorans]|uniref:IS3 family transposase n=1 Tax=Caldibacillus thermoamylovorans TaxID=35841 RepID=UPI0005B6EB9C|nr:IS3 family transposase [Caldibacillus thermoamylovorans]KIO58411.1 hypothetical protein B4065_3741 [Caldibacillus thermoamylovorans]
MIDWDDKELPIITQAELLGLNRSSLYYKPVEPSPEEIFIKHKIDEIYTKHPYFGSRRITVVLNNSGLTINRKAVHVYGKIKVQSFAKEKCRVLH